MILPSIEAYLGKTFNFRINTCDESLVFIRYPGKKQYPEHLM